MIVILNNGTQIRIAREIGQAIVKKLLDSHHEGARWQCILSTADALISGFNLAHVAAICEESDIIQPLNK